MVSTDRQKVICEKLESIRKNSEQMVSAMNEFIENVNKTNELMQQVMERLSITFEGLYRTDDDLVFPPDDTKITDVVKQTGIIPGQISAEEIIKAMSKEGD